MRILKWIVLILVIVLIVSQLVPVDKTNSPVDRTLTLESRTSVPPQVDQMLRRSCYDCHSYETNWRWWTKVAPASWLVANDVKGGRNNLNFSDWAGYTKPRQANKLDQLCKEVRSGGMPLWYYVPLHPGTRLSDAGRQTLCTWSNQLRSQLIASMTPAERAQMKKRRPAGAQQ